MGDDEFEAGAALIAAKDAYRADPSEENKKAKAEATARLQSIRNQARADRTGVSVSGDAVATES